MADYNGQYTGQQIDEAVGKVSELSLKVGDLDDLETTAKSDLVSAINEVNSKPSGGGSGGGNATITYNSDGSATITNGTTSKKFLPMDLVAKYGVIKQTITYNNTDGTHTCSNLEWGYIPMASINQWVTAGAEFNDTDSSIEKTTPWGEKVMHLSGYFYLNGLGDISAEEMDVIYLLGDISFSVQTPGVDNNYCVRTRLMSSTRSLWTSSPVQQFIGNVNKAETLYCRDMAIAANRGYAVTKSPYDIWYTNRYFTAVYGISFSIYNAVAEITSNVLKHCYVMNFPKGIKLIDASMLTNASVLFMIQHACNGTTDITITLHANAYTRAMADDDIQAALTTNGHITLASA